VIGRNNRHFPVDIAFADRAPKTLQFDIDSDLGEVADIGRVDRSDAETRCGLAITSDSAESRDSAPFTKLPVICIRELDEKPLRGTPDSKQDRRDAHSALTSHYAQNGIKRPAFWQHTTWSISPFYSIV
jgi:hypothetical protein